MEVAPATHRPTETQRPEAAPEPHRRLAREASLSGCALLRQACYDGRVTQRQAMALAQHRRPKWKASRSDCPLLRQAVHDASVMLRLVAALAWHRHSPWGALPRRLACLGETVTPRSAAVPAPCHPPMPEGSPSGRPLPGQAYRDEGERQRLAATLAQHRQSRQEASPSGCPLPQLDGQVEAGRGGHRSWQACRLRTPKRKHPERQPPVKTGPLRHHRGETDPGDRCQSGDPLGVPFPASPEQRQVQALGREQPRPRHGPSLNLLVRPRSAAPRPPPCPHR